MNEIVLIQERKEPAAGGRLTLPATPHTQCTLRAVKPARCRHVVKAVKMVRTRAGARRRRDGAGGGGQGPVKVLGSRRARSPCLHSFIHTFIHTHIETDTYIHSFIRTHIETVTTSSVPLPSFIHAYIHTYTYRDRHIHTFIHTHIETDKYIHSYIHI